MGPPRKKSEGAQSGDLGGGQGNKARLYSPTLTIQRCGSSYRPTRMFQCSVLLEEEIPGISCGNKHIQVTCTSLLAKRKTACFWNIHLSLLHMDFQYPRIAHYDNSGSRIKQLRRWISTGRWNLIVQSFLNSSRWTGSSGFKCCRSYTRYGLKHNHRRTIIHILYCEFAASGKLTKVSLTVELWMGWQSLTS